MESGRLREVVAHEGSTVITNAARTLIWAHSRPGLSFMKKRPLKPNKLQAYERWQERLSTIILIFMCTFPRQQRYHSLKIFGPLYISGQLPTYPSPKPTFCPK